MGTWKRSFSGFLVFRHTLFDFRNAGTVVKNLFYSLNHLCVFVPVQVLLENPRKFGFRPILGRWRSILWKFSAMMHKKEAGALTQRLGVGYYLQKKIHSVEVWNYTVKKPVLMADDNFFKFDVQCFGRHLNQVVLVLEIRHVCSTAEFRVHRAWKETQDNRWIYESKTGATNNQHSGFGVATTSWKHIINHSNKCSILQNVLR